MNQDFLSSLNQDFTACVACKILVQTRQKFQFIKLDFSNSIFQNPSADRYSDGILDLCIFMNVSHTTTTHSHLRTKSSQNRQILLAPVPPCNGEHGKKCNEHQYILLLATLCCGGPFDVKESVSALCSQQASLLAKLWPNIQSSR